MSTGVFVVDPAAPPRLSMSFIRAAEGCLRRAHHEREVDLAGGMAITGRVFHEVAHTVGMACAFRGEVSPREGEAEEVARRVLANPEEASPLPKATWDEVMSLVARWARGVEFAPDEQFEVLSRQELGGRTLSARIDRMAIRDGVLYVRDYKTGWGKPEDQGTDCPLQGEVYAWHGRRLFPGIEKVVYTEDWVRFGVTLGPFDLWPEQLDDVEAFLRTSIARIDKAYEDGCELPASPGHACSSPTRCPVAGSCPVPLWARPGVRVESEEDAVAEFEQVLVLEQQAAERKKAIRAWLEANDHRAVVVNGQEIGWPDKPGSRIDEVAVRAAGYDPARFRVPTTPSFGRRKATT